MMILNNKLNKLQSKNLYLNIYLNILLFFSSSECCIFSKQVTECTQECDNLKEVNSFLNIKF
jgi:hypothetical protein